MLKRLLMIGALCVGLVALGGTDAYAWPASSSGWGATQNTVTIWSGWKGIANSELKPTSVRVTLDCVVLAAQCFNHGGGEGGLGTPFMIPAAVTATQTSPQKAIKNGKWDSFITFDEEVDFGLVRDSAYCINPNWENVGFVTKSFRVYIRAFEDVNTRCFTTCDPSTDLTGYCAPPLGDTDTCFTACTVDKDGNTICKQPDVSTTDTTEPWVLEEVVHIEGSCDLGSAPIGVNSAYTCKNIGPGPAPGYKQWEYSRTYKTCFDQYGDNCLYPW